MGSWTGLDFFLFLIFLVNTLLGMSRGATKEIMSMMCVSVGLIFTIRFTAPLAIFLNKSPLVESVIKSQYVQNFMQAIGAPPLTYVMVINTASALAIVICFVGAYATAEAVLSFTGITETFPFPYATWNRKVGAALGCIRGYIFNVLVILVFTLYLFLPVSENSVFIKMFYPTAVKFNELILHQDVEHYRDIYKDRNLYRAKDVLKEVT